MPFSAWLAIWTLHVAVLAIPGANVLLIAHLGASAGRRSALWAALGVCLGTVVWAGSAVLGVHTLFALVPAARTVLQVAGAMYLLWIASRLWRSGRAGAAAAASPPLPRAHAFRLGALTNLSNPKSALFFGSVFSTALPAQASGAVMAGAVSLVVANALAFHLLLGWTMSIAAVRSGYAAQRGVLSRVGGAVLGAFGLSLLVASLREVRR